MEYTDDEVERAFIKFINAAIDATELVREKDSPLKAAGQLTEIIGLVNNGNNQSLLARALGHRIVCLKNLYKNEGLPIYLHGMAKDVERGLSMALRPNDKAVFYLRAGDLALFERRFDDAENFYEIACRVVPKGGREEAEYLGHWAHSKSVLENHSEAIRLWQDALQLLKRDKLVRKFHRRIVRSGITSKLFFAALATNRYFLATRFFLSALSDAWILKTVHKMPQRWNDLIKDLNY